jgi:hypothetical protein
LSGLCKKRKKSCSTPSRKEWQGPTIPVRFESICNPSNNFSSIPIVSCKTNEYFVLVLCSFLDSVK